MKYVQMHREAASNIIIGLILIGLGFYAWSQQPTVTSVKQSPPAKLSCPHHIRAAKVQAKVSDSAGTRATLNIFIGPGGGDVARNSSPLAIETGKLVPGSYLCTIISDLVRSDGQILPAGQVTSHAQVSRDGRYVTIRLSVAPRYRQVSGYGEYSGTVSLDDPRSFGANVPVRVYIEYPYINRVLFFGLLAAAFGLFWALIVRMVDSNTQATEQTAMFWPSLALRVAVLATAIPVLNAQVLSNPSWTGSLSEYIKLGTVAGAAAIATAPTLSAIVSRVKLSPPASATQSHAASAKSADKAHGSVALWAAHHGAVDDDFLTSDSAAIEQADDDS